MISSSYDTSQLGRKSPFPPRHAIHLWLKSTNCMGSQGIAPVKDRVGSALHLHCTWRDHPWWDIGGFKLIRASVWAQKETTAWHRLSLPRFGSEILAASSEMYPTRYTLADTVNKYQSWSEIQLLSNIIWDMWRHRSAFVYPLAASQENEESS